MFTMQTRQMFSVETFSTLDLALAAGFSTGSEFDVSAPSGAIVWAWEQRDERAQAQELAMAA
jgi:hypothetical protein